MAESIYIECQQSFAHDHSLGLNVVRIDFQGGEVITACCPYCSTAQVKPRTVMGIDQHGRVFDLGIEIFEHDGQVLEVRRSN